MRWLRSPLNVDPAVAIGVPEKWKCQALVALERDGNFSDPFRHVATGLLAPERIAVTRLALVVRPAESFAVVRPFAAL